MSKYQVVFSIVNAGCHEQVMACAREAGATGGTVIHARGTSNPLAASKFGIVVQPEKEIVMIVVEEQIKDDVLRALYKTVGVKTECNGIAFAHPSQPLRKTTKMPPNKPLPNKSKTSKM